MLLHKYGKYGKYDKYNKYNKYNKYGKYGKYCEYQMMKITLWTSISSSCLSSLRFFFGAWPLPILSAWGVEKPARQKNSENCSFFQFSSLFWPGSILPAWGLKPRKNVKIRHLPIVKFTKITQGKICEATLLSIFGLSDLLQWRC